MVKVQWLDRALTTGPYFCLCVTESSFRAALKHLKVPADRWPEWITPGRDATTHHLELKGDDAHIVCMRITKKHDGIQTYALLVHEAVHIWQAYRKSIGEDEPGSENEAYTVQHLSQELMLSYDKQRRKRK